MIPTQRQAGTRHITLRAISLISFPAVELGLKNKVPNVAK